ncbi:hypothetical protein GCM10011579_006410 [Streptomyces albiflavescens]|uniref:Uncharacterized protein n=1 Tax=Streptomyces albiflavescens TaxID=1623582 RepID=A0A917XRT0_9ACTN|nr:hypothetical protein [Streptomyces albiflavescens]GGN51017.1 hypothetical protein GCM10011579_006410 [Streptomyces albiflavescens]
MAEYEASQTPQPQSREPRTPPAPLTAAWLRAHFDPLPFPARMSALARYARTLTPHAYESLHRALDAGDSSERHTALFLAVVRRDLDRVTDALADSLLSRRARSAALRLPIPEHALERLALSDVRATRHDTYRLLRLSRRRTLAAELLPQVYERYGDREAARLLSACPAETVLEWLPRLDVPLGALNSLARTTPRAVAEYVAARREERTPHDAHRIMCHFRAVASVAAQRDPHAALILLERAPDLLTPPAVLAALRLPAEALAVLHAARPLSDGRPREHLIPAGPLSPSHRRALEERPVEDLVALAEHCPSTGSRERGPGRREVVADGLLRLLPHAERLRIVESRTVGRGRMRGVTLNTLAALAPADRANLLGPWLERHGRPSWSTARLAAALPLAQGEPLLRELAANHRVHHRAQAWPALLACAELEGDRDQFARIAGDCERAWHDQDVVRCAALQQLAGAAPHLLTALPERVLRDAVLTTVQSRDSTAATLSAAERLLRRIAERAAATGRHARTAYAIELLGQVVSAPRHTGPVVPLNIGEEATRTLWSAMAPTALQRPELGTVLAELLGHHLTALPDLDDHVRRTALEVDDPELAARAAAAWVRPPQSREHRCAELIGLDATFATVPVVLRTIAARRTDLLDPVLTAAREGFSGRVRPRATSWAPRLHPGVVRRWLPQQQEQWEEHHARVAADEAAPLRTRADAATLLREPGRLTALADSAPQPVAAAALTALGEDPPAESSAVLRDILLRHAAAGGVRGRAAMTSLRRLLERLPDREAVPLLAPVASSTRAPVGARKEAVRALGALFGEDAFEALVVAWDVPGQHPDVRAVLARCLLVGIDRPGVTRRLVEAAGEAVVRDAVVHPRVGAVPVSSREAYAAFLARLVEEGDDDTAVAACHALPAWLTPGATDAMRVLVEAFAAPDRRPTVWNVAARHLAGLPPGAATEAALRGAFDALRERAGSLDPQVRADALRRLHGCPDVLVPGYGGAHLREEVADTLVDTLEAVGLHADAARLSWNAAMADVRRGEYEEHRWERLLRLCETQPQRLRSLQYLSVDLDRARVPEALLAATRTLRTRQTPTSGRLALHLVGLGGRGTRWDDPWRAELDALRTHTDHDTAMAALLVDPDESR